MMTTGRRPGFSIRCQAPHGTSTVARGLSRHALPPISMRGEPATMETLRSAIVEGAVLRVRPKAMTVAVIMAGLLPIMLSEGTGAEVMQRIAAPMVGGMITAPLLSMFVIPAVYLLLRRQRSAMDGRLIAREAIHESP